ncbi:MAG: DUF1456 family protein [Colwelliaceae bacterium]|nr:DUF1456 family protein [Colwelliaceae bacterium]
MTNNDVLRRIRYTFNLRDEKVVAIFAHANCKVSEEQVQNWLKKDDDAEMVEIIDVELASFLNGFIIEKRGKRDGAQQKPEKTLTKNLMLMKLKIALQLQNEDIVDLLATTGFTLGKSELTAFFRKPDHKNYRHCKSQFLRNFLQALQDKHRKPYTPKNKPKNKQESENDELSEEPVSNAYKSATPNASKLYVNPNASNKSEKKSSRKVLKLKPEDIYK